MLLSPLHPPCNLLILYCSPVCANPIIARAGEGPERGCKWGLTRRRGCVRGLWAGPAPPGGRRDGTGLDPRHPRGHKGPHPPGPGARFGCQILGGHTSGGPDPGARGSPPYDPLPGSRWGGRTQSRGGGPARGLPAACPGRWDPRFYNSAIPVF